MRNMYYAMKDRIERDVPVTYRNYPCNLLYAAYKEYYVNRQRISPNDFMSMIPLVVTGDTIKDRTLSCIEMLDDRTRNVLVMRFKEYKSLLEIGSKFDMTDAGIKHVVSKGVNFLADFCIEYITTGNSDHFPIQPCENIIEFGVDFRVVRFLFRAGIYSISDVIKAYMTTKGCEEGRNKLMEVDNIGVETYEKITSKLALWGYIAYPIMQWKDSEFTRWEKSHIERRK